MNLQVTKWVKRKCLYCRKTSFYLLHLAYLMQRLQLQNINHFMKKDLNRKGGRAMCALQVLLMSRSTNSRYFMPRQKYLLEQCPKGDMRVSTVAHSYPIINPQCTCAEGHSLILSVNNCLDSFITEPHSSVRSLCGMVLVEHMLQLQHSSMVLQAVATANH